MYFFRSKSMSKYQITFSQENVFECLRELAYAERCHFVYDEEEYTPCDLYYMEVIMCNNLLTIVHYMEIYLNEHNTPVKYYPNIDEEFVPEAGDLARFENDITTADAKLKSFVHYEIDLHRRKERLEEQSLVLDKVHHFFGVANTDEVIIVWTSELVQQIRNNPASLESEGKLNFFFGTIPTESFYSFERMLYRVTRGSHLIKSEQIVISQYQPLREDLKLRKTVFMVGFIGQTMGEKIYKVINGFRAELFDVPTNPKQRLELKTECDEGVRDLDLILPLSDIERVKLIEYIQNQVFIWKINLHKLLTLYTQLNKMQVLPAHSKRVYLQIDCWIPKDAIDRVKDALSNGAAKASRSNSPLGLAVPIILPKTVLTEEIAPTDFKLNNFTRGFQKLIDSYGMPTYKELNPTPYTIVTFPFLFAVMFGDFGHGLIVTIFATILIFKNKKYVETSKSKKSRNEIADIIFAGRYIILLMGIFSCYTGLIYNDVFSKPISLFGNSHWRVDVSAEDINAIPAHVKISLDPANPKNYIGDPYYFGIDPVWKTAGDESIVTFNSIKMKLSIILGVVHMLFGLVLAAVNNKYFKNKIDLILLTIPQILIFSCLFLYLVFMIFFKWSVYGGHNTGRLGSSCAPSILITFINMFLLKETEADEGCDAFMFAGQKYLQYVLIGITLVCIPILLAGKPIYFHLLKRRIQKMKNRHDKRRFIERSNIDAQRSLFYNVEYNRPSTSSSRTSELEPPAAEFDMLEVWIHSAIHCIDSVLGAISHTASYLRLWALSLAHEQLSHVLWSMVLAKSFTCNLSNYCVLMLVPSFFIWAILTISILVTMEGLSAFLHTLRLHWVEFQSKFYSGTGIAFLPFRFEKSSMNTQ